MAVKVLIVDDSGFFRRRVAEILQPMEDIRVVGAASNGQEAIELTAKLRPDVITMDYEMPVMDGITAVRHIMQSQPTPVLMFSSLTYDGARVTFDALEAGAVDYLPKSFEALSGDAGKVKKLLHDRIIAVAKSRPGQRAGAGAGPVRTKTPARGALSPTTTSVSLKPKPGLQRTPAGVARQPLRPGISPREIQPASKEAAQPRQRKVQTSKARRREYVLVAIGTSTGGPVALRKIITQLPANFPRPLVLVQHMPGTFTPAFAERLNNSSQIRVKQAEHGEILKPGCAYLAPGGKQMLIERSGGQGKVKLLEGDQRLHYKPSVDVTFGSAAKMFPGKVLGIILTGMGADGREGCRMLKKTDSMVWSQDEETSVIYGMPMAVAKAGLSDQVYALDEFSKRLVEGVA